MIGALFSNPLVFMIWTLAILLAITIHEFAHAWMANRLGDPTPRLQGRLTLNPLAHLDPIGTLMLLFVRFGWGKPVQFDPFNLEDPRRDAAIISLAGPASNILLASVLGIAMHLFNFPFGSFLYNLFDAVITLNVVLAVFNLVPIHPLDGGKILSALLPPRESASYDLFMGRYGVFVLLVLIFPVWGGVSPILEILTPMIRLLRSLYIPQAGFF